MKSDYLDPISILHSFQQGFFGFLDEEARSGYPGTSEYGLWGMAAVGLASCFESFGCTLDGGERIRVVRNDLSRGDACGLPNETRGRQNSDSDREYESK
jgi:hypothetical protein